jgi:hypothetical protein
MRNLLCRIAKIAHATKSKDADSNNSTIAEIVNSAVLKNSNPINVN